MKVLLGILIVTLKFQGILKKKLEIAGITLISTRTMRLGHIQAVVFLEKVTEDRPVTYLK